MSHKLCGSGAINDTAGSRAGDRVGGPARKRPCHLRKFGSCDDRDGMVRVTGLRRLVGLICVCVIMALVGVSAASAQAWWESIEDGKPELQHGFLPEPSIATSMPKNGDPAGFRKWLGERGVIYGLEYTNDILSNVRGGLRTGTIDQGKLHGILAVDLRQAHGSQRPELLRQLLPDPQHRAHPARLRRRHSTPSPRSKRCRRRGFRRCGSSRVSQATRQA